MNVRIEIVNVINKNFIFLDCIIVKISVEN